MLHGYGSRANVLRGAYDTALCNHGVNVSSAMLKSFDAFEGFEIALENSVMFFLGGRARECK